MSMDRYQRSPSGRLVPIVHNGERHRAFVPSPLPPEFERVDELWQALSKADRSLAELAGWGREVANPTLFIRPFIRQEAVSSSRIEGTRADLADLYVYEAEQISFRDVESEARRPDRTRQDAMEVHNYVQALEYGLERLETLPLVRRLLCELHERLMEGVRGEHRRRGTFREHQNWIGPRNSDLPQAEYVPPPVNEMQDALDDLERYLNGDGKYPPLIRIALSHYQFEAIHPFADGNGRVGRLLIALQLVHWDLLPIPLLYLSSYFERNRTQYIELMREISASGAWVDWLLFFLEGVRVQSRQAIRTAETLKNLKVSWREGLMAGKASSSALKLAEYLFERPVLSVPDARDYLALSYGAARYNIKKLEEEGIVRELSVSTHPQLYVAPKILDALSPRSMSEEERGPEAAAH